MTRTTIVKASVQNTQRLPGFILCTLHVLRPYTLEPHAIEHRGWDVRLSPQEVGMSPLRSAPPSITGTHPNTHFCTTLLRSATLLRPSSGCPGLLKPRRVRGPCSGLWGTLWLFVPGYPFPRTGPMHRARPTFPPRSTPSSCFGFSTSSARFLPPAYSFILYYSLRCFPWRGVSLYTSVAPEPLHSSFVTSVSLR